MEINREKIRKVVPKVLVEVKKRHGKRGDPNRTYYTKRQYAFSTPQSTIEKKDRMKVGNLRNITPRVHRSMFENHKSIDKQSKDIKLAYLKSALGRESRSQK